MLFHEFFEKFAKETPNHPAICFNGEVLTYAQANEYANKLANQLLKEGVAVGDRVAMRVERSAEQVIISLAFSKIGAVYVPLLPPNNTYSDNDQESELNRIKTVLHDCHPKMILGNEKLINEIDYECKKISINSLEDIKKLELVENQNIQISEEDIAYIIYSSGTTGKPKGVQIKHSGLVYWGNILASYQDIKQESRIANFISVGFDAHIWEYLMTWANGATLYVMDKKTSSDPSALIDFFIKNHITHATLIPTILRSIDLPKNASQLKNSGLEVVYSTGESCTPDIVKPLLSTGIKLNNCYGPSELTFGTHVYPVTSIPTENSDIPIGSPVNDEVKQYILKEKNGSFAQVDDGELFLESPYMTSGYIDPKNNEGRIIEAYVDGTLRRLFRTGDHVYKLDGVTYYKGRLNLESHVKISGELVELRGIENCLRGFEKIKDACVMAIEDEVTKISSLVAFCATGASVDKIDQAEIKKYLKDHISSISIPEKFVFLDELPKTSNAKLDRKKLQSMRINRDCTKVENEPRNALEEKLLIFWKDFFKSTEIDIKKSDYQSLGGNSVNLILLRNKLKEKFNTNEIPISKLAPLDKLTIEKLANIVYEYQKITDNSSVVTQESLLGKNHPNVFFVPDIMGNGSSYASLINSMQQEVNCYTLNSPSLTNNAFSTSIESIASFYIKSMKQQVKDLNSCVLIGWSFGAEVAWEIARQLEKEGVEISLLYLIDSVSPILKSELGDEYYCTQLQALTEKINETFEKQNSKIKLPNNFFDTSKEYSAQKIKSDLPFQEGQKKLIDLIMSNLIASRNHAPKKLQIDPHLHYAELTKKIIEKTCEDSNKTATLGWSMTQTSCVIPPRSIAGDHFSILKHPELVENITHAIKLSRNKKSQLSRTNDYTIIELKNDINLLGGLMRTVIIPLLTSGHFFIGEKKTKRNRQVLALDLSSSTDSLFGVNKNKKQKMDQESPYFSINKELNT